MPRRNFRTAFLLLAAAAFCAGPLRAQTGLEFSTMSVKAVKEESPLMLNLTKDSRDSRVGLDYAIRWDFSDIAHIRPGLKTLADGISAVRNWDITENTRVRYYGFAANPWRIFIAKEKTAGAADPDSRGAMTAGGEKPEYRKRLRLSFSPLVDDLKRNLDEELRDALLQNALKPAGPQWQHVNTAGKKDFVRDVMALDLWDVPGLGGAKEGLQYISK